ncbi:hypothetical protein DPMN_003220 [Dreissena polymorpha]|uniref:Uncharacterized protein n=1 Tax=Dreissena polymorpha TaxID=45954 RepID=A0A9D4MLF3_DREPO|nr:hypothetical protein DPMN_003220 [Dreissena polymorpha]
MADFGLVKCRLLVAIPASSSRSASSSRHSCTLACISLMKMSWSAHSLLRPN